MSNITTIPSVINVVANITVGSQFTGQNIVLSGAPQPLLIHSTSQAAAFVVSGPRVGINMANPAYHLDVTGSGHLTSDFKVDGAGSFANLAVQTSISGNNANFAGTGSFATMYATTYNNLPVGNEALGSLYRSGIVVQEVLIHASGAPNALTLISGGNVGLGLASPAYKLDVSGGALGLQVNGSTFVVSGGLIGMGISTPANTKTHVRINAAGSVSNALRLENSPGQAGVGAGIIFYGDTTPTFSDVDHTGRVYSAFDGNAYSTGRLTLQSPVGTNSWTDVLTVKDSKVGIGTTSPSTTLTISGGSITHSLLVHASGGINAFAVTSGGLIGIGTNVPTSTLDVRGLGSFTNLAVQTAISGNTLNLAGALIGATTGSFASIAATTSISGNNINLAGSLVTIGPVGIGTVSPATQLETYGTAGNIMNWITLATDTTASTSAQLVFRAGATPATKIAIGIDPSDGYKLKIKTGDGVIGTTEFVISSGLGIGTNTPGDKLTVVGNIAVSGIGVFKAGASTGVNFSGTITTLLISGGIVIGAT